MSWCLTGAFQTAGDPCASGNLRELGSRNLPTAWFLENQFLSRAVFLIAFTSAAGSLKRPTATSLFAAFTDINNREGAMVKVVFVVCRGFHDCRDGM